MSTSSVSQKTNPNPPVSTFELTDEALRERQINTMKSVERKLHIFDRSLAILQREAFSPESQKIFNRRWKIGKAADMAGTSRQLIRIREKQKELPPRTSAHAATGYTLDEINHIRDVMGTRPRRADTDRPMVLSFSTFKGGCGKTTMSVHCAQYLALKGYRVLYIDCDPQASATTLFGINPDLPVPGMAPSSAELNEDEEGIDYTMAEFIAGYFDEFVACIRESYFPGIDLVPADLELNNAEYELVRTVNDDPSQLNVLRDGIRSVWHNYDVIILDPPPALGLLSLSVMNAAEALIIPLRPSLVDYASTRKFIKMMKNNLASMINAELPVGYDFETFLVNNVDESKSAHHEVIDAMRTMFTSKDLIDAMMKDSAEIDNAGKDLMTVYDLPGPTTSRETYNRCIKYLDRVNGEIETRIRRTWPSHIPQLRAEAQI